MNEKVLRVGSKKKVQVTDLVPETGFLSVLV